MEPVDVGSLPADEVIEMLFEGGVLHSLLEQHGAACFALARFTYGLLARIIL